MYCVQISTIREKCNHKGRTNVRITILDSNAQVNEEYIIGCRTILVTISDLSIELKWVPMAGFIGQDRLGTYVCVIIVWLCIGALANVACYTAYKSASARARDGGSD
jgi:hypothetical protein